MLKSNFAVQAKYEAFYTGGKVQISSDGSHIFCQCEQSINVVDYANGQTVKTLTEDEDKVSHFIVSPNDELLMVAYKSLLLRHWDWKEGTVVRKWKSTHISPILTMAYDPTSTLLATGGADANVRVWDTHRRQCTNSFRQHTGIISLTGFHPDSERLHLITACSGDYMLRVWSLRENSCLAVLRGHFSVVTQVQFSRDGNTMYSGGRDNVVLVWCLASYSRTLTIPIFESVEGLYLLPEGETYPHLNVTTGDSHFITAGSKGLMRVWNSRRACCVFEQRLSYVDSQKDRQPTAEGESEAKEDHEDQKTFEITDMRYVKALNALMTVTFDHNIILYNRDDFALSKQFVGYSDEIVDICYLTDRYVLIATNSELVKLLDMETGSMCLLRGHQELLMCLGVAKQAGYFATGSKDGVMILWRFDVESGRAVRIAQCQGHTMALSAVAFSNLSTRFLVTGSYDMTLKLWPLPVDKLKSLLEDPASKMPELELKPSLMERAHEKDVNWLVVAPNDKLIATASADKTAKIWSVDSLQLLGVCRGHTRGVWCVKFSPVDQCVATASSDNTIRIWALSDYSCVKTFQGHEASVLNIHFLSRGMQILSSAADGIIKLWTLKIDECACTLDTHETRVWALAFNSDESRFLSGSVDSKLIHWKDITEEEVEEERTNQTNLLLKEQEIQNLLQQKRFVRALSLAINLDQPFRVLTIIKNILKDATGTKELDTTLMCLKDFQIDAILRYAVEWNTNSKNCEVAQHILSLILQTHTLDDLLKLSNFKSSLEGLIPYTERHSQRLGRLQQQCTFLDYTWQCMRLVGGASFDEEASLNDMLDLAEIPTASSSITSLPIEASTGTSTVTPIETFITPSTEEPSENNKANTELKDSEDLESDDENSSDSEPEDGEDDAPVSSDSEFEASTATKGKAVTRTLDTSIVSDKRDRTSENVDNVNTDDSQTSYVNDANASTRDETIEAAKASDPTITTQNTVQISHEKADDTNMETVQNESDDKSSIKEVDEEVLADDSRDSGQESAESDMDEGEPGEVETKTLNVVQHATKLSKNNNKLELELYGPYTALKNKGKSFKARIEKRSKAVRTGKVRKPTRNNRKVQNLKRPLHGR